MGFTVGILALDFVQVVRSASFHVVDIFYGGCEDNVQTPLASLQGLLICTRLGVFSETESIFARHGWTLLS